MVRSPIRRVARCAPGAILMLSCTLAAPAAWAKAIAVVTGADSRMTPLTEGQARDFFLGDDELLPNGARVVPVDQAKDSDIARAFYTSVVHMSLKDVAVHWAKKVFAGRGTPPARVEGDAAVKAWLKGKDYGIGYIYADAVDPGVKVLLTVEQ